MYFSNLKDKIIVLASIAYFDVPDLWELYYCKTKRNLCVQINELGFTILVDFDKLVSIQDGPFIMTCKQHKCFMSKMFLTTQKLIV